MAIGLRLVTERGGYGSGVPIIDIGEELMHMQLGVSIVLGNRPPETPGTLYLSNMRVLWLSDTDRSKGYAVDFVSISHHAVSRDPQAYPSPCIYIQIETVAKDNKSSASESESDDLSQISEMRLVPSDRMDILFEVFRECAELNPDPIEEDEVELIWMSRFDLVGNEAPEHGDGLEWAVPRNSVGANGNHDLVRSVMQLQINDQRFEDADEMDQDDKN